MPGYPDRILPKNEKAAAELKKRTLTNLYNARPQWLADAHRDLDAAVAAAYGWPCRHFGGGRAGEASRAQPAAGRRRGGRSGGTGFGGRGRVNFASSFRGTHAAREPGIQRPVKIPPDLWIPGSLAIARPSGLSTPVFDGLLDARKRAYGSRPGMTAGLF